MGTLRILSNPFMSHAFLLLVSKQLRTISKVPFVAFLGFAKTHKCLHLSLATHVTPASSDVMDGVYTPPEDDWGRVRDEARVQPHVFARHY